MVLDKKRRIAKQFGKSAKRYDDIAQVQLDIGFDAIQQVPQSGAKMIDVGCGTGRLTQILAQRFASVTAIDLSAGMLEQAQNTNQNATNIEFKLADAECLPFADRHFDYFFSSMVLQWCDPIETSFAEAFRVLKPGASGLIAMLSNGSLNELQSTWQQLGEPARVNRFYSHQYLVDAIQAVGFQVNHQQKSYTTYHQNLLVLLNSIRHVGASILPVASGLPMLTRAKMRMLEACYTDGFATKGQLPLSYQVSFFAVSKPQ